MYYQQNTTEALTSVKVLLSAMVTWPKMVFRNAISPTHSVFLSCSASTSHGLGPFPREVTYPFISDEHVTFVILIVLDCCHLPLTLITRHNFRQRLPQGSAASQT